MYNEKPQGQPQMMQPPHMMPPPQTMQPPQMMPPPQMMQPQMMQPQMVQPQPTMGMTVAPGGNKNSKNLPYNAEGKREWSHGLCDCFDDCGTCMLSWCCPCMVYSKVKRRAEYLNTHGKPDPEQGGSGCDGDCMLHCCLTGIFGAGWVLQIFNRGVVRNRYNIAGEGFGDCCTACFCTPCELTQESREIELEERSLMH
ncbi:hypothetical protein AX17_003860 [Amanita inopinata Kibby_2008]|nr:hypothetical protein AX17_003860 [Amanita inopinata Kibby_2008]